MTTYYELLDNMLKVTGNNGDVVQLRDLNGKPWVLPAAVVDTLSKVVGPKEGSVWRNTNSGDIFIYHEGNLHNPKLIMNLRFFLKNPHLWEKYDKLAEDGFADKVQDLLEETPYSSLVFTNTPSGRVSVEYSRDDTSFNFEAPEYAAGVDVVEALDNLEFQQNFSSDGTQVLL